MASMASDGGSGAASEGSGRRSERRARRYAVTTAPTHTPAAIHPEPSAMLKRAGTITGPAWAVTKTLKFRVRFECHQTKTLTNFECQCQTQGSNVRHTGSDVRLTLNLSLTFEPCQTAIPPLLFQVRM